MGWIQSWDLRLGLSHESAKSGRSMSPLRKDTFSVAIPSRLTSFTANSTRLSSCILRSTPGIEIPIRRRRGVQKKTEIAKKTAKKASSAFNIEDDDGIQEVEKNIFVKEEDDPQVQFVPSEFVPECPCKSLSSWLFSMICKMPTDAWGLENALKICQSSRLLCSDTSRRLLKLIFFISTAISEINYSN